MEVAARRDGALVAELRLDQGERLALSSELRSVRVSEAVGVHALLDPGFPRKPAQETADPGLADRPAVERAEDGRVPVDAECSSAVHPARQELAGSGIEAHEAVPVALAVEHAQGPAFQVRILRPQREGLSEADPRAPQRRNERPSPEARGASVAGSEQPLDVLRRQGFGCQSPAPPGPT